MLKKTKQNNPYLYLAGFSVLLQKAPGGMVVTIPKLIREEDLRQYLFTIRLIQP